LTTLIRNTATGNAILRKDGREDFEEVRDGGCEDFEKVYSEEDIQVFKNAFANIPDGIRESILGRVIHRVMTQAALWTKRESPSCSSASLLTTTLFTF
jgi:hypothetical protein